MPSTAHLNGAGPEQAPLRELRNFVLRHRWSMLGLPLLALLAAAAFVFTATPRYEADATLRIDEQQSTLPVLDALKSLSSGSKIETEMEVLASRTLAEDVVDSLGLQLRLARPASAPRSGIFARVSGTRASGDRRYTLVRRADGRFDVEADSGAQRGTVAPGEALALDGGASVRLAPGSARYPRIVFDVLGFDKAVKEFRDALSVARPNRDADIVEIRYEGRDRELVRAVPDLLSARFIAWRQGVRSTEARSTVHFLGDQIDTLSGQLASAEDALRDYRQATHMIAPEAEARADVTRLSELQGQREAIDAEQAAFSALVTEIEHAPTGAGPSPYRRLIAFPSLLRNPATTELLRSLSDVDEKRTELLSRRTSEDPDVRALSERVHGLEQQLYSIATTYRQGLSNQVASLDAVLARSGADMSQIPAREVRYARLQRQAHVLEDIFSLLQTRLKEAQIAAAVEDASVRVIDPSILPERPIWPKKVLSLLLALIVGLALGVGAGVAREHLDTTVHTREDAQRATGGLPVLGLIPRIAPSAGAGPRWSRKPAFTDRLIVGREPLGPVAEAYRSLRTNITYSRADAAPRTLVFTSATPGDGKSTTALNLALTLGQQELRCLLIDADLRRGVLHRVLGLAGEPGLSNVLLGKAQLSDALRRVDLGAGGSLDLLPCGFSPPNPAELLGSSRMRDLLKKLEESYDMVILDAPPLNLVTDAALLGRNAEGVVLVARAGFSERGALSYAIEQLAAVRAPTLGLVLNDVNPRTDAHYGSYSPTAHYYTTAGGND